MAFLTKKKQGAGCPYHHPGRKRPNARKFTRKKWWASWLKAFKNKIINKFTMRCLSFSKKISDNKIEPWASIAGARRFSAILHFP
jgi:hypothetical protein